MLLIALGIGRKINYCYLFIFFLCGSILINFMQMILVLGLLFVVMYKSVVIYQNTTLCHKLRVCNFNNIQ